MTKCKCNVLGVNVMCLGHCNPIFIIYAVTKTTQIYECVQINKASIISGREREEEKEINIQRQSRVGSLYWWIYHTSLQSVINPVRTLECEYRKC